MRMTTLVLRTLAIGCLAVVLIGQLGRISVTADMLNAFLVPVGAVLLIVVLIALFRRDRWTGATAFVGLAIASAQFLGACLEVAPRTPPSRGSLRIVSLNAFHDNGDTAALTSAITRAKPDILMVEEANGAAGATVLSLLPGYSRVVSCAAPPCSLVILSRWPASRIIERAPPRTKLPDLLSARVRTPFGNIKVIAAHLPRSNLPGARTFTDMLAVAARAADGMPVLLGGDFNLPTGSFGLARFERDAGLSRAERWIPTYPANLPLPAIVAIDHIYVSQTWRVQGCDRLPAAGSDHFGLTCELAPATGTNTLRGD